ncbi:hypothetical protein HDU78_006226 [Chytriomyces hyalinus]|nr:hypothetical protein HDU78_006226 [Chytriomyces hyalinus]KAJ3253232.1 hypothetical protein HDU77_004677 [Chytriomyces hyalinus]
MSSFQCPTTAAPTPPNNHGPIHLAARNIPDNRTREPASLPLRHPLPPPPHLAAAKSETKDFLVASRPLEQIRHSTTPIHISLPLPPVSARLVPATGRSSQETWCFPEFPAFQHKYRNVNTPPPPPNTFTRYTNQQHIVNSSNRRRRHRSHRRSSNPPTGSTSSTSATPSTGSANTVPEFSANLLIPPSTHKKAQLSSSQPVQHQHHHTRGRRNSASLSTRRRNSASSAGSMMCGNGNSPLNLHAFKAWVESVSANPASLHNCKPNHVSSPGAAHETKRSPVQQPAALLDLAHSNLHALMRESGMTPLDPITREELRDATSSAFDTLTTCASESEGEDGSGWDYDGYDGYDLMDGEDEMRDGDDSDVSGGVDAVQEEEEMFEIEADIDDAFRELGI